MYFSEDTIDDLMLPVLQELLRRPCNIQSRRGKSSEILGAMLHLQNPRARISRSETRGKPFSALGELMWYLSKDKSLEFISYYIKQYEGESSDGKTVYGGYGPRIFKLRDEIDQFKNITDLLTEHQSSRKAVIQIFDGIDLVDEHPEIPCTCTLQFLIRDNRLNMFTTMRSNDAFLGLPHDIFTFTMLQEIIARQLNVDLGIYTHAVGSLHLYEGDQVNAQKYIEEGYHSTKDVMPDMPFGDPWPALKILSEEEIKIRNGENINEMDLQIDDYWIDLIRLLKVYSSLRENNLQGVETLKSEMKSSVYNIYLDQKIKHIKLKP